jgi:hypothetical protein
MELQTPDEDTMVKGATAHLGDRFPTVASSRIESTVRRFVREWRARARIKVFVGIIAERHARAELEGSTVPGSRA